MDKSMKVNKKLNGSELLMEIEGGIDSTTAPELNDILAASINGITSLILDFKNVDYISSAGLRVLLVNYKAMTGKGEMIIRNVNGNVMDIFTMTGFVNILTIEN